MGQIFKETSKKDPGFFQRLFKKEPIDNAFIELNNLLATKELNSISTADVNAISARYKIDLSKKFPDKLKDLYGKYLAYCLTDNKLEDGEIEELKKLKSLLGLKDKDIEETHNQVAGQIYKKSFEQMIKDGRLEKKNEDFLERLEQDLKISKNLADKISGEARQLFIQNYVKKITSDERLSPDELEELESISKSLNVNLDLDSKSREAFDKMKRYWIIENGELPALQVDINLQKNETCYVQTRADWHELRTVTKRINYAGPSARIKIMKGLSYRVGSVSVERVTSEHMQHLDSGILYVTNKRLIFTGQKKNANIKLDKILSITPYSDGIEVIKDAGRNPVFIVPSNADILSMTLSRVINEL